MKSLFSMFMSKPETISCKEVGKQLQIFLDGEINSAIANKIAEHLELCEMCGLEAQTIERIKNTIAIHREPIPSSVIDELQIFANQIAQNEKEEDI